MSKNEHQQLKKAMSQAEYEPVKSDEQLYFTSAIQEQGTESLKQGPTHALVSWISMLLTK